MSTPSTISVDHKYGHGGDDANVNNVHHQLQLVSVDDDDINDMDDDNDTDEQQPLNPQSSIVVDHVERSASSSSSSLPRSRSSSWFTILLTFITVIGVMITLSSYVQHNHNASTDSSMSLTASSSSSRHLATSGTDSIHACPMGSYFDASHTPTRGDNKYRHGCSVCIVNHWCNGGDDQPVACVDSSAAPVGAHTSQQCTCIAGRYLDTPKSEYDGTGDAPVSSCKICQSGYYCPGNNMMEPCGTGIWRSPEGTTSLHGCSCLPGQYPTFRPLLSSDATISTSVDWQCASCEYDHECNDGHLHRCPVNSYADVGARECLCSPGYAIAAPPLVPPNPQIPSSLRSPGLVCGICQHDHWCPGGKHPAKPCPLGAAVGHHDEGAKDVDECQCNDGYYYRIEHDPTYLGACTPCNENSYCVRSIMYQCPPYQMSMEGTADIKECYCLPGFIAVAIVPSPSSSNHHDSESTTTAADGKTSMIDVRTIATMTCVACLANHQCLHGKMTPCPAGSYAEMGSSYCSCLPGTYGDPSVECFVCPIGAYCPGGATITNATLCASPRTTKSTASRYATDCVCPLGSLLIANTQECQPCPTNHHCNDYGAAVAIACTAGRTSPIGSYQVTQCACLEGSTAVNGSEPCLPCAGDHYCIGGDHQAACGSYMTSPVNSTSRTACHCLPPRIGPAGGPCLRGYEDGPASDRLVHTPILFQGLCNQVISLQEIVTIAASVNGVLCWPQVMLDGLGSQQTTPYSESMARPFEALWDKEWFTERVFIKYGVVMATKRADIELCDFITATQWTRVPFDEACRSEPGGMDCAQLATSFQSFPETPFDVDGYNHAYDHGARILYFGTVFQQWIVRMRVEHAPPTIPIFGDDVLRPCAILQHRIAQVMAHYDRHLTAATHVIGLHLRIEPDIRNMCGDTKSIVQRICHDLETSCGTATCIVATGATRWEYEQDLPCSTILTKEQAWPLDEPIPDLHREEAAIVDLWTVTRAHVFAGCGYSTLSIAGFSLHPLRLHEWRNDTAGMTHALAVKVPLVDTGELQYTPSWAAQCSPLTQRWIDDHHLSYVCPDTDAPAPDPATTAPTNSI